jgi:tRNA dimethylallyltransferase
MKSTVIVIAGPTASGKTSLSIDIARHFQTEIISADSRQCYREMSIGTAVPSAEELATVRHHFIHSHSIHQPLTAGKYMEQARKILSELFQKNEVVVVTGGTGLYLKSLIHGIDQLPSVSQQTREKVKEIFANEGIEELRNLLQKNDPVYLEKADQQNPARLMRATEIILETGKPYSSFLKQQTEQQLPYQIISVVIDHDRKVLYDRINQRVDQMIEMGLEEEVRQLLPYKDLTTLHTVGYNEFFEYFDNSLTLPETISAIKQHSRNYAKRQLTWFRNQDSYTFYAPEMIKGEIIRQIV